MLLLIVTYVCTYCCLFLVIFGHCWLVVFFWWHLLSSEPPNWGTGTTSSRGYGCKTIGGSDGTKRLIGACHVTSLVLTGGGMGHEHDLYQTLVMADIATRVYNPVLPW